MFTKKFTVIISFFLIIAIGIGGMLGYYDARLEAAVTPKKQSMDKVKIKNEEDLTFDKDVVNILLTEDTETLDEVVVIGYGTVKKAT